MNIKDNIAEEFDAFSANYTQDMIGCVPYYMKLMSHFMDHLPDGFEPKEILDLGCGNGNATATFIEQYSNAQYSLLDASKEMLQLCKQRFKDYSVKCINSYFQDFEFKKNHFDLIIAGFSLHHCTTAEKQLLFKKIYESLARGGMFMCSDLMISKNNPDHSILKDNWKQFVHQTFPDGKKWEWLMEHYNEFDKPDNLNDQITWLKELKFDRIDVKVYENYWGHFRAIKN